MYEYSDEKQNPIFTYDAVSTEQEAHQDAINETSEGTGGQEIQRRK